MKSKIFQTAIGGMPSTTKSGNRTNAPYLVSGLTFDDKNFNSGSAHADNGVGRGTYSRAGGAYSVSNLNVPSVGPLLTSPTAAAEEYIQSQDIQSIVEFKRREEQLVDEFYMA